MCLPRGARWSAFDAITRWTRSVRGFSKLGDVVAALGEFERGNQCEKGSLLRVITRWCAGKVRLFRKHHVDLGAGPVHSDAVDGANGIGGKISFRYHAEESTFGIGIREHDARSDFRAVFEDDGSHSAITYIDLLYGALVRVSAPNARAALAMAPVMAPMPPITWP